MVVSEFVGCSRSLSGAIRVNPWNLEEVANAIQTALTMDSFEKHKKHEKSLQNIKYVTTHTVEYWAERLSSELRSCIAMDQGDFFSLGIGLDLKIGALSREFSRLNFSQLARAYAAAPSRLFLLNCDSLFQQFPSAVQHVIALAQDKANVVFILSAHACTTLESWFESAPAEARAALGLVAEHGCYMRSPGDSCWRRNAEEFSASALEWLDDVLSVFRTFTEKTDGSYIEQKETSISWHYENADPDFGHYQAKDAYGHLEMTLTNSQTEILFENKKIEVKMQRCNKGMAVERILSEHWRVRNEGSPLILCMGDDQSDESMFSQLHEKKSSGELASNCQVFSCTLSTKPSQASYFITDLEDMMHLLSRLSDMAQQPSHSSPPAERRT